MFFLTDTLLPEYSYLFEEELGKFCRRGMQYLEKWVETYWAATQPEFQRKTKRGQGGTSQRTQIFGRHTEEREGGLTAREIK